VSGRRILWCGRDDDSEAADRLRCHRPAAIGRRRRLLTRRPAAAIVEVKPVPHLPGLLPHRCRHKAADRRRRPAAGGRRGPPTPLTRRRRPRIHTLLPSPPPGNFPSHSRQAERRRAATVAASLARPAAKLQPACADRDGALTPVVASAFQGHCRRDPSSLELFAMGLRSRPLAMEGVVSFKLGIRQAARTRYAPTSSSPSTFLISPDRGGT
jgi:hypothetical protein